MTETSFSLLDCREYFCTRGLTQASHTSRGSVTRYNLAGNKSKGIVCDYDKVLSNCSTGLGWGTPCHVKHSEGSIRSNSRKANN